MTPDRKELLRRIDWELLSAKNALRDHNDGRARVSCRRAAALAISGYNELNPGCAVAGATAMEKIKSISTSNRFPVIVQNAALRLATNIRDRLTVNFTFHPVNDAEIIINFFLSE